MVMKLLFLWQFGSIIFIIEELSQQWIVTVLVDSKVVAHTINDYRGNCILNSKVYQLHSITTVENELSASQSFLCPPSPIQTPSLTQHSANKDNSNHSFRIWSVLHKNFIDYTNWPLCPGFKWTFVFSF